MFYWLASGFHRHHGMLDIALKEEVVEVIEGSRRMAVLYSVGSNPNDLGLERNDDDKRHAVWLLLSDREWWKKSDNWIATTCMVSHHLVAKIRHRMIAEKESQSQERANKRAKRAQNQATPAPATPPLPAANVPSCADDAAIENRLGAAPSRVDIQPSEPSSLSTTLAATGQMSIPVTEPTPQPETTETDDDGTRLGQDGRTIRTRNIGKKASKAPAKTNAHRNEPVKKCKIKGLVKPIKQLVAQGELPERTAEWFAKAHNHDKQMGFIDGKSPEEILAAIQTWYDEGTVALRIGNIMAPFTHDDFFKHTGLDPLKASPECRRQALFHLTRAREKLDEIIARINGAASE